MHYGIVAIGSRGDVQPYIALALGLMGRGHQVTIFAHENFKSFVEGYGMDFVAVRGNVEEMLRSGEGMAMLRKGTLSAFTRYLQRVNVITGKSLSSDVFGEMKKADVLIASLLSIAWVDALSEKLRKKWAIVQLNLPAIRTRAFPLVLLDFFDFPLYNRLTYRLFEWGYWRVNKKNINQFRRSLDLPVLQRSVLKKIADEKILNLHCFSPALLPRPNDWASQNQITGFLFLPDENRKANAADNISPNLISWIGDGDEPVYIGFGSIPVPDTQLFSSVLKDLLRKTTHRFIYCRGWSPPMDLPDHPRLFKINSVDHQWLFPRCRTAVIHGGIGTTAAVLKAKIPPIIVSLIADQPWWGKIIERKGLGVHIPFKTLTSQKLISAIVKVSGGETRRNAVEMGERIGRENGLHKTIDALEIYY